MEQKHTVYIDERKELTVTGAVDVVGFTEDEVLIKLVEGNLVVKGEGLHMHQLDPEEGRAVLSGRIHSVTYTQKRSKEKGLWARLWK